MSCTVLVSNTCKQIWRCMVLQLLTTISIYLKHQHYSEVCIGNHLTRKDYHKKLNACPLFCFIYFEIPKKSTSALFLYHIKFLFDFKNGNGKMKSIGHTLLKSRLHSLITQFVSVRFVDVYRCRTGSVLSSTLELFDKSEAIVSTSSAD